MIYYPLSTLMLAGIKDILIILTPEDTPRLENLLGDGSQFGISLSYAVQPSPDGLAQAFIIGEEFIGDEPSAMIPGDNIFYGNGLYGLMNEVIKAAKDGKVLSVEEKPKTPKSNYAITGLYFYPAGENNKAKDVKLSACGELEINTHNDDYLQEELLNVKLMGRGFAWLDTGTMESLLKASNFISVIEEQQGGMISASEEIAYRYQWISEVKLLELTAKYGKSPYGEHLKTVAGGKLRK